MAAPFPVNVPAVIVPDTVIPVKFVILAPVVIAAPANGKNDNEIFINYR
jgi:hypothetical protein